MSPQERESILDENIKGINLRLVYTIVAGTAIGVATILGVYYNLKGEIDLLKYKVQQLEGKK